MSICTPAGQFYPTDPNDLVQSQADSPRIDKQRRLEVVVQNASSIGGDATAANQELEIGQLQNVNDSLNAIETDIDTIRTDTSIIKNSVATSAKQDEQTAILTSLDNNTAFLPYIATEATLLETNNKLDSANSNLGSIENQTAIHLPAIDASLVAIDSKIAQVDTDNVTVVSSVLPTGASTSALQTSGNASLTSIDGKLTTLNAKDFATATKQDIQTSYLSSIDVHAAGIESNSTDTVSWLSAIDTRLSFQATALNQGAGNVSLASIDGKLILPSSLGQKTMANSLAVTIASDQNLIATSALQTTGNNSLASIDATNATIDTNTATIRSNTTNINNKLPAALGQTTMANSLAVTIASNQSALSVDTELPAAGALGDSVSNPTTPMIGAGLMSFGGTNFERVRSGNTGASLSLTGYLNNLPYGLYASSPGTLTNGQSHVFTLDVNKNLRVRDADSVALLTTIDADTGSINSKLPTAAALADTFSNPSPTSLGSCISGFNGSTWDRVRTGLTSATLVTTGYLDTIQFGKYSSTVPTLSDGMIAPIQFDSRNFVRVSNYPSIAIMFRNQGANATLNIKANPGYFFWIECRNANAAIRYLQIWNTATVAGTGTLVYEMLVAGSSNRLIDTFPSTGIFCSTGIAYGFSTTTGTYTAGTASEQVTQICYA